MSLISIQNISKMFSGEYIFENIKFTIEKNDKIGLIGRNGTGKTTLFKILTDLENIDINFEDKKKGMITKAKGLKIGYLRQNMELNLENSVFEEMMSRFQEVKEIREKISAINLELKNCSFKELEEKMEILDQLTNKNEALGGDTLEYRIKRTLNGLGIGEEYYSQKIAKLSGGERNRVALSGILIEEPDLLLLDEPTNHLDLDAIEWLENYLASYKGSFVIISHDRYFLNKTVNRVLELENSKIVSYNGNFDAFIKQKEERLKGLIKEYEKQQEHINKTEEFIRKYKAGIKARQARGREKQLNRLARVENPKINQKNINLTFEQEYKSVDLVLEVKNLNKSFGDNVIFNKADFKLYRGERIGIIGKNGTGKSTLLKIISNKESFTGDVKLGERVKIGYYDQNQENLNPENNVLEELLANFILSEEAARNILGGFLFTDEEINKTVKHLSGGEKARLCFAKLLLEKPNLLIMDEPTNHLDIYTKEVLEDALQDYEGTIITVSHDREFLRKIVDDVYILANKKVNRFNGNYEKYRQQVGEVGESKEVTNDYEEQKRIKNLKNSLQKSIEEKNKKIDELEKKKQKKELELEEHSKHNDFEKLAELDSKIKEYEDEIIELMLEIDEDEEQLSNS